MYMTGRTHDLAAFTFLNLYLVTQNIYAFSLATALVALFACFLGGLFPDIDKPSSDIWDKIPGGSIFGRLSQPFLGAHRHFSHSLLGMAFYGFLIKMLLHLAGTYILVDMQIVWVALMIGMFSHLFMDSLTSKGVPWLFPIHVHLRVFDIRTGGKAEKIIVCPALLILNVYLLYTYYPKYFEIINNLR